MTRAYYQNGNCLSAIEISSARAARPVKPADVEDEKSLNGDMIPRRVPAIGFHFMHDREQLMRQIIFRSDIIQTALYDCLLCSFLNPGDAPEGDFISLDKVFPWNPLHPIAH